jgi:predicted PurR-regulated permease PerM
MQFISGKITLKKTNRVLFFFGLLCAILYFGKPVLIPVCFSAFFAMLFTPLSNRMERAGVKRVWTAGTSVLIILLVTAGISMLVYMQSRKLAGQFPRIEKRAQELLHKAQSVVSSKLNITQQKQDEVIKKQVRTAFESSGKLFKDFVSGFFGLFTMAVLVLILTFLLLFQREKYESFFVALNGEDANPDEARQLIWCVSRVAQSYLTGRVLSILIFTVLFTTGFLIIGLESAFLLALIAALLTIVPYVGSIVGGIFPFAVALVTEDSVNTALGALMVVGIVQAIDNYFIEPYIIGGEVNLSAFATIVILFIGGLLWGIAGMILFLPLLGIAKIVFDAVPSLKIYGYLIGDQEDKKPSKKMMEKIRKLFGKSERNSESRK